MKVIQGNFSKDKSKSLNEKLTEGLTKIENSSNEEALRYPFILIVDTGEELTGDLVEYRDNNPTQSSLFWALNEKAEEEDEGDFEGFSDTNINTMKSAIETAEKNNPGSGIVVDNDIIKRLDKRDERW